MSDDQAREMRPETTSEHIARDMREGRFPEQSERQMVPVLASLPHEIQVWRSMDALDHTGTWSTTRYPPEAVTYVPKSDAAAAVALVIINLESDLLDRVLEGSVWSMPEGTHTTDEWGRGVTDARRDIAAAVRATFADIADNDGLAMVSEPHDPGDGWTWNERLGWIGPDGKPADPRRRG